MVCDEVNKQSKLLPPSKNGGLTAIRKSLNSDSRVLRDVAAGSSFKTALISEKVREIHNKKWFITELFYNLYFMWYVQDSLKDTRTPNMAKQEGKCEHMFSSYSFTPFCL